MQGQGETFSEKPHDILAAEEFAMPAQDPELHHGPVTPPGDPSGILEAHDVLAAEEFAMPAHRPSGSVGSSTPGSSRARAIVTLAALVVLVRVLRRR